MSIKSNLYAVVAIICLPIVTSASFAGAYKRLELAGGISLDVPSHWTRLTDAETRNLNAASVAAIESSGITPANGTKKTLLAVNAPPSPTGATIRLSVRTPPTYSQTDLAAATGSDLAELTKDFGETLRKALKGTSMRVIAIQPFRVETLNNNRALVMQYTRTQPNSSAMWEVFQYKIPTDRQLIELTLSYRQSDALLWSSILLKVRNSLEF